MSVNWHQLESHTTFEETSKSSFQWGTNNRNFWHWHCTFAGQNL